MGLPLVIATYPKEGPDKWADLTGITLITYAIAITVWSNGGFGDARSVVATALLAVGGYAAFGQQRAGTITMVFAGVLMVTVIATELGWLSQFTVQEQNSNITRIIVPVNLAVFGLCLWLHMQYVQLSHRLLWQASSEALHARRAESRFLSNMSHEILNPLNGVSGILYDIAHHASSKEEAQQSAHTGLTAAMHLQQTVNDILDLKSLEEGSLTIEPTSTDIYAQSEQRNATWRTITRQKGVNYNTGSRDPNIPRYLIMDYRRFSRVMHNIISNAVKFTDQGSVTVAGRYRNGELIVTVSDTGIGMTPDVLAEVFSRSPKSRESYSFNYGGTGLGLSVSKELIEAMGGWIKAESELGKGTVVTVCLPAPVDTTREALWRSGQIKPNNAQSIVSEAASLAGLRVLAVNDDAINLRVLCRALEHAGAEAILARSAREALNLVEQQTVDLVITDISMPNMSGEELQQILHQRYPDLLVIALTGNARSEDTARFRASGFAAVVNKPFDSKQLCELVAKLLSKKLGDKEAPSD